MINRTTYRIKWKYYPKVKLETGWSAGWPPKRVIVVCANVYVWLYLWKAEVDAGCLSQLFLTLFSETGSLVEPGVHQVTSLAGEKTPGILRSPLLQCPGLWLWIYTVMSSFEGWALEGQTQAYTVMWQTFYYLNQLTIPLFQWLKSKSQKEAK